MSVMNVMYYFDIIFMIAIALFFLVLAISSLVERQIRATTIAFAAIVVNFIFWLILIMNLNITLVKYFNIAVLVILVIFGIGSIIQIFPGSRPERSMARAVRYDERDQMFSRNNIQYHSEIMKQYYKKNPHKESTDREIHSKPEFGDSRHVYYDYYVTPCYVAAFDYLQRTIHVSRGIPAKNKRKIDKVEFCNSLTGIARFYGACDVGFTSLRDYHLYSHRGRHEECWGEEVESDHRSAIVIVVPMEVGLFKKAPTNVVIQESARKYVEVAKISNIIAAYIWNFGYRARAHNDANYDTLCVPLAVDAGLGELGRLGVLIHNKYGPCVRLAVVTTELELPQTERKRYYMEEFCNFCKKCSDNCPTGAICGSDEPESRGFRHWSIDQEKCFAFWKKIGTDCGFCLAVCPYAKPNSFFHKLVRFYVSRNPLNQRIALFFDDLIYGRRKKTPGENEDNIFS